MPRPPLSVVIPTLDRPEAARAVALQCLEQAPPNAEIVLVDQSRAAAVRDTAAWVVRRADRRLQHLVLRPEGLPRARNAGLAATTGAVVLFLDDDVTLLPGCLASHLAGYRDPTVGGVVGRILEDRLQPNAWWTTNRIGVGGRIRTRLDGPDPVEVATLKGANMSVRRLAVTQAGPFDPGFAGTSLLEDADLSARLRKVGWRLRYCPDAGVRHHHHPTGGVRAEQPDAVHAEWWRFHNTARFIRKHRGWAGLPPFLATFTAVAVTRAAQWRRPRQAGVLLAALAEGWSSTEVPAGGAPDPKAPG